MNGSGETPIELEDTGSRSDQRAEPTMEPRIFVKHYRISPDAAGSPAELGRSGAAIVHRGIDLRSNQPVALQLIPLASIDPVARDQFEQRARSAQKLDHVNIARVLEVGTEDEFLVLVSEFVEGETTDAWVVANGPMPPEAGLRVGLEVVRALETAAFFSLTHSALQPSNIMIVPGAAPDGGWPFVKLLNFGLASAESHASETPGAVLAPAIAPQFASPEQLRNQPLDFRSEVYSLAATVCFLLTGAAPLTNGANGRFRHLELRGLPRALRDLLGAMLSEKPDDRPQDPVALEKEMRQCLTTLERRQSIRRKWGIPMIAVPPRSTVSATPGAQIVRGAIAFAVLVLVAAGVAAAFFPGMLRLGRSPKEIGVPIGVPQSSGTTAVQNSTPVSSEATSSNPAPTVVAADQVPTVAASPAGAELADAAQSATTSQPPQPPVPAEGPDEGATAASGANNQSLPSNNAAPNESDTTASAPAATNSEHALASRSRSQAKTPAAGTSARRSRVDDNQAEESVRRAEGQRLHRGYLRARLIGMTPDGRPILRLPSGRVVIATPGAPIQEFPPPRRRIIVREPDSDEPPPFQPFSNGGPRD